MFQEFYAKSDLLAWPMVGLLIFVAIFVGVVAFVVFGLKDKNTLDEVSSLPLADDTGENQAEGRPESNE
nr:hypothetical protein [Candidatus Krumholzibacteria bacterium]